jgi:hypothetical protein
VAAFTILTEPFADQVQRVMAYQSTDRELPAIVIPHPIQNVSPDELRQRAEAIADAAERFLGGRRDE